MSALLLGNEVKKMIKHAKPELLDRFICLAIIYTESPAGLFLQKGGVLWPDFYRKIASCVPAFSVFQT